MKIKIFGRVKKASSISAKFAHHNYYLHAMAVRKINYIYQNEKYSQFLIKIRFLKFKRIRIRVSENIF